MSTARPLPPRSPSPFSTGCPQKNLRAAANDRTHSDDPVFEFAMNATWRPSGDTLKSTASVVKREPSGGKMENSICSGAAGATLRRLSSIVPPNVRIRAAAMKGPLISSLPSAAIVRMPKI